jgi:hypothetical protein
MNEGPLKGWFLFDGDVALQFYASESICSPLAKMVVQWLKLSPNKS